jgi:hypothetical protein
VAEIRFECPGCGARHTRGFVNGVNVFRCLRCGYAGHGFSTDFESDRLAYAEHCENNALHRALGIPEVPLGVDPLGGPG